MVHVWIDWVSTKEMKYDMKGREYYSYMIAINTVFHLSGNHLNGDIPK